jgi:hypothetical protein
MISAYNSTTQTLAVGDAYTFDTNRIATGCTVGHVVGTPAFVLTKPGYYYVSFNTTFTSQTTGDATVSLLKDGVAIPGATGTQTISTAGDITSVAFASIVKVLPSCCAIDNTATLTFVVSGLAIDATVGAVNITKLC